MTKSVSAAEAKARLSEIVGRVAHAGERIVIERRGKPMAALVPLDDLQTLESAGTGKKGPKGALALVGLWSEIPDGEIDEMIREIYESRARDLGRPVNLEDDNVSP